MSRVKGWAATSTVGFIRDLFVRQNESAKVLVRVNGALFHVSGAWTDSAMHPDCPRVILDLGVPYDYANPDGIVRSE